MSDAVGALALVARTVKCSGAPAVTVRTWKRCERNVAKNSTEVGIAAKSGIVVL